MTVPFPKVIFDENNLKPGHCAISRWLSQWKEYQGFRVFELTYHSLSTQKIRQQYTHLHSCLKSINSKTSQQWESLISLMCYCNQREFTTMQWHLWAKTKMQGLFLLKNWHTVKQIEQMVVSLETLHSLHYIRILPNQQILSQLRDISFHFIFSKRQTRGYIAIQCLR